MESRRFGRVFSKAADAMAQVEVTMRGFDMEVIQLPGGSFGHFVEHLHMNYSE
jgi:hypothetical protein